jgi:hypothetical protein
MPIINLKKTLKPEDLAAMTRNTMVDGGGVDKSVMEKFNQLLAERLEKIPSQPLRKAIDEAVREKAMGKLLDATPKQVDKILKDSFNEIAQSLGIAEPKPKKPAAPKAPPPSSSSGGKYSPSSSSTSYGGKYSPPPPPPPSRRYGGK